jgi:hypothetical protein
MKKHIKFLTRLKMLLAADYVDFIDYLRNRLDYHRLTAKRVKIKTGKNLYSVIPDSIRYPAGPPGPKNTLCDLCVSNEQSEWVVKLSFSVLLKNFNVCLRLV